MTRLLSAAGTGYFYTIKKPRIKDRMTLRKYDPVGKMTDTACLMVIMWSNSPTVRKHVLFIEQKKK